MGTVFLPFHFVEAAANVLTLNKIDPRAKIPDFKMAAVQLHRDRSAPAARGHGRTAGTAWGDQRTDLLGALARVLLRAALNPLLLLPQGKGVNRIRSEPISLALRESD